MTEYSSNYIKIKLDNCLLFFFIVANVATTFLKLPKESKDNHHYVYDNIWYFFLLKSHFITLVESQNTFCSSSSKLNHFKIEGRTFSVWNFCKLPQWHCDPSCLFKISQSSCFIVTVSKLVTKPQTSVAAALLLQLSKYTLIFFNFDLDFSV